MNGSPHNMRVLIVEDEPLQVMELTEILEAEKYDVVGTAGSISDALHCIHADEFDIALVDVNLSGETTERVADLLAEQTVPFGVVTAYPCHILPRQFRHRPYITKPYVAREIRALAGHLANEAKRAEATGKTAISSEGH
jgi:DNA-binding response OmpR family regulator